MNRIGPPLRPPVLHAILAIALATAGLVGLAPPPPAAAALPAWTGSIDLYRAGTFTTQKTWLWCTAADVQIMRNIVKRDADHSRAAQQRYFAWMRDHNRYTIPESDGVDPAGWTAGLRRFVDDRYRLTQSRSFDAALRSAVTSLRRTNLPVGITVGRGTHAWVLTGFTATADPATTKAFTVRSVRLVGPLWGLQSRTYGYDMRPGTSLTPRQLAGFFTPWHYGGVRMAWEGRWVSVLPTGPAATDAAAPSVSPSPLSQPPSPSPLASSAASSAQSAEPSVAPTPPAVALAPEPAASAGPAPTPAATTSASLAPLVALLVGAAVASLLLAIAVIRVRTRRSS